MSKNSIWGWIKFLLLVLLLASLAITFVRSLYAELFGQTRSHREGEPCGDGYHWIEIRGAYDTEFSCEKDR